MSTSSSRSRFWIVGALAALLAAGSPAFADNGGHGGGGGGGGGHASGGGGGHAGGGGGHAAGGFGGHAGGGGGAHYSGRGYGGGFAGGARPGGSYGARTYNAPRGNFGLGGHASFAPRGNYVASAGFRGGAGGSNIARSAYGRPGVGRPSVGRPGFVNGGYARGYGHGYGRSWGGGYWRGAFWPRCSYGWGFPLFLPLLPAVYATYYWDDIPYYYANNVYYTYNPDQSGYVVTDPPPVAGTADDAGPSDNSAPDSSAPDNSQPAPSSDVYAYPQNGQTEEQQSNDKYECHNWARSQTGYDPTHVSGAQSGSPADYQRAMTACLNARGYSAK